MTKKILLLSFLIISELIYSQGLYVVQNNIGKYGFTDKNGDTIISCDYDYAEDFSNGLALVKNNLRLNIIDTAGFLHPVSDYDGSERYRHDLGEYHDGLPILIKVWDCSYISSGGETYLSIPYNNAESFSDNKAKVYDGDKYNYVSRNGLILDEWKNQTDNYHAIKKGNKFGYIDKNAKLVIDYQFLKSTDFANDFGQISNGTYWAIINKKGVKISDWYEKIEPFSGNLAIVHKLGNLGFINKEGRFVGKWYERIESLGFNLYKVSKYNQFAIVNDEGYLVTQWFEEIGEFRKGFVEVKKDSRYAYINRIGAMVIGWYDSISAINNDITRIIDKDKYAFFNVEKFIISDFFDYLGDFNAGIALFKKGDKFGYVNKLAQVIIEPQYDSISDFSSGIAQVKKDNKVAYINTEGKVIMGWYDCKNYIYSYPPEGLIAVKIGRKYGFQTINGKRIISSRYDYAENFSHGLALVKTNPREMLIDINGNLKPLDSYPEDKTLRLDWGYGHSKKPIKITIWDCAYINSKGEEVIKTKYNDAFSFASGKAKVVKGDKFNYINTKGELIDTWKDSPEDYRIAFENGKFGFIDKNRKVVIDYKYGRAYEFDNGLAKVLLGSRKSGKFAIINLKGETISKLYDDISDFEDGVAIVKDNNKYAIINRSGELVSKWYDKINKFSENKAVVKLNNKFSFITVKGEEFNKWYDQCGNFTNKRAKIKLNDKWGFVDAKGNIIVYPKFDSASDFDGNIAKVEMDNKYTFIDMNGKFITDWFDRIYRFSNERAVVCKDNKWGYIDANGKVIIKLIYQKAFAFFNDEAVVIFDNKQLKIDKFGKEITDTDSD